MIKKFNVLSPGSEDEAAHQGGTDADPCDRARTGDPGPGTGDHPERERTRRHGPQASRGGEIQAGEDGRG